MLKFSEYSKIPGIKINENVVKIGNTFSVTMTYDVPLQIVKDYIDKVKNETGKNALESFGAEVLAEKLIKYALDQYLTMDNIPATAFVGGTTASTTDTTAEPSEPAETELEIVETDTKAEEPAKKEEEEEESNYMNIYTTMGNPVSTGIVIDPPTQKSPKNAKVGLYEGLTDADLK